MLTALQEELDYIFAISTRKFMAHQCFRVMPWWIKRYIFWQKNIGPCPALWTFEGHVEGDDAFVKKVRNEDKERRASHAP